MGSCNDLQEKNKKSNVPDNYKDQTPQLCANGCGFFGTKAFKNLCSKCFTQSVLQNQKEEKDENPNNSPFPCFNKNINKGDLLTTNILQNQKEEKDHKPNKNPFPCFNKNNNKDDLLTRNEDAADNEKKNEKVLCTCCEKRIRGLMIYKCRCNGRFCIKHRYPEEHKCNFDFKILGRLDLAKENPSYISFIAFANGGVQNNVNHQYLLYIVSICSHHLFKMTRSSITAE